MGESTGFALEHYFALAKPIKTTAGNGSDRLARFRSPTRIELVLKLLFHFTARSGGIVQSEFSLVSVSSNESRVTGRAQRDQVLFGVVARMASETLVMDL